MFMTTMSKYSMDYVYNHRILLTVNFWRYFYGNNMAVRPPTSFFRPPISFLGLHSCYLLFCGIFTVTTWSVCPPTSFSGLHSCYLLFQYCHHNQILVIVVSQVVSFYCFGYQIATFKLKIITMRHTHLQWVNGIKNSIHEIFQGIF